MTLHNVISVAVSSKSINNIQVIFMNTSFLALVELKCLLMQTNSNVNVNHLLRIELSLLLSPSSRMTD